MKSDTTNSSARGPPDPMAIDTAAFKRRPGEYIDHRCAPSQKGRESAPGLLPTIQLTHCHR